MSNNKGFTLIEMMIVLVIIGFILAMAYPSLSGAVDMSNNKDCIEQEYVVKKAIIEYYALTGTWPSQGVNFASDLAQQTGVRLNSEKYQYNYTRNGDVVSLTVYMMIKDHW